MEQITNNQTFLILIAIFISFLITEKYLSNHHLTATILIVIILYFFHSYLTSIRKNDEKNLDDFKIFFDIKKYPYIFRTKKIYNIYVNLSFLTKYNEVSFQDSAFYMNQFLKLIYDLDKILLLKDSNTQVNISDMCEKYLNYSNESLNILFSIVINIKDELGILTEYSGDNKILTTPSIDILEDNLKKLFNIVTNLRNILIKEINKKNIQNINISSKFLNDETFPTHNPLNSYDYMKNFNLY